MGSETMDRVLTEATIENLKDLWDAERGLLPPEEVRRITVPDALVDTGATLLSLPASHPELARRAHTICHCANICLRLGLRVRWDAATERFLDDPHANRMLHRAPRPPWLV
jgi:hypothetical protein